jgi:thiol-disulfide isomerase/thioredoxin
MKPLIVCIAFLFSINMHAQNIKSIKIADVKKYIDTVTHPVIINFWASWCKPCINEIPWFEKAVATHKNAYVELVLISVDFKEDYPKVLQQFVNKNKYTSTIWWLNETDANYFCSVIDKSWTGTIPVTLMVNNATKYKQFYNQQIPEPQLGIALQKLITK